LARYLVELLDADDAAHSPLMISVSCSLSVAPPPPPPRSRVSLTSTWVDGSGRTSSECACVDCGGWCGLSRALSLVPSVLLALHTQRIVLPFERLRQYATRSSLFAVLHLLYGMWEVDPRWHVPYHAIPRPHTRKHSRSRTLARPLLLLRNIEAYFSAWIAES